MLAMIDRSMTSGRAKAAALAMLAIYLVTTVVWLATTHRLIDAFHQPLGGDFIIFYSASSLTLHGHAAMAFDPQALLAVERAVIPGVREGLKWCYPPTFQLLIAPLALAPFPVAYGLFVAAGLIPYLLLIQMIRPGRVSLLMSGAFPGAFVNAWQGQNGFLTTSLMGFGLISIDRRPWLAGAMLGLLVYKPQFGILLPVLLIGTGRWKSALAAALGGAAFIGLSLLVLGPGPWLAFFRTLPDVSAALSAGRLPWSKIASIFVAARWLGAPPGLAYFLQGLMAVLVASATLLAWRRPGPHGPKVGLAVLATFLMSPYSFNYDLVLLAIPIAVTLQYGRAAVLPEGTKAALLLAAFTPMLFLGVAKLTHLQLMPAAILICYCALFRIVWRCEPALGHLGRAPEMRLTAGAAAQARS
ncbi:MAG TPA: glycosyltransferase family 87 protein [Caulobacteraceae bacterium]